jgi:hypothetical protein
MVVHLLRPLWEPYTFNFLTSPHYGMEYRIDVIGATTDKAMIHGWLLHKDYHSGAEESVLHHTLAR